MPESCDEFIALVRQMREAQRSYFKTRSAEWLSESKRLERKVDEAIKAADDIQPKLF
jgi:hypothetical protein